MAVEEEKKMLEISGLTVVYQTDDEVIHAVNSLDLDLYYGESLGLVGETGAGKTTTALSILQLVSDPPGRITAGKILFEGEDLLKADKRAMRRYRGNEISAVAGAYLHQINIFLVVDTGVEVIRLGFHVQEGKKALDFVMEFVVNSFGHVIRPAFSDGNVRVNAAGIEMLIGKAAENQLAVHRKPVPGDLVAVFFYVFFDNKALAAGIGHGGVYGSF